MDTPPSEQNHQSADAAQQDEPRQAAVDASEQRQQTDADQHDAERHIHIGPARLIWYRLSNSSWRFMRRFTAARLTGAFTFGILIVTAFYTYYAQRQATSVDQSLAEMVRQTPQIQRSAKAAEEAAMAAKVSADAARISADASATQARAAVEANQLAEQIRVDNVVAFKQQNRAELRHEQQLAAEPNEKGTLTIRFPLRNERPTDATNIRLRVLLGVGRNVSRPTLPESDWQKLAPERSISTVFARQQGRSFNTTLTIDPTGLKRYNSGENLYVFTRLRYCDVFKESHWVNVCAYRAKNRGNNGFSLCGIETGEGDDAADEQECQGQPKD